VTASRHPSANKMSHLKHSLLLLLALLALSGRAPAQQPASARDEPRAADAALRQKAFDLLETIADQIGTLQSVENRARLGSNIAALLWKHDEQRARTLLAAVQSDINLGLQRVDEDERANTQIRTVFLKLRMDTIERIARQDAEAALAFLQATEPDPALANFDELAEMTEGLEAQLANQIAAENPDLALKLGRKSLSRGFSNALLPLLRLLLKKDKEKARSLYKEAVAQLVSTGLKQHSPEFHFARSLALLYKPPVIDEQAYRELIKLFVDTAFQHGCNKAETENNSYSFCHEFGWLLPQMEKVDAARAAELKLLARPSEWQYDAAVYEQMEHVAQTGTLDEMVAFAEAHPHMKERIYWRALWMAEQSGDIEGARKITRTHIDPSQRAEIMARLDKAESWLSMSTEKLAELQEALTEIPTTYGKAMVLMYFANQIGGKDRKSALKLANQASEMIDTMKPGREQTEAEIHLAMIYCLEKDERGLDKMQSLMPKLNELIAATVKLDGFESFNLRDGEWNMSNVGIIGNLLTGLSSGAAYFAWCDFDRATTMAGQFERTEIRLMAQLKLAQAILAGPPKRVLSPAITFSH